MCPEASNIVHSPKRIQTLKLNGALWYDRYDIMILPKEGCDRVKNQLHIPTTLQLTKIMFLINTCSYK